MRSIGYGAAPGGGHLASLLDPPPDPPPFRGRGTRLAATAAISSDHALVGDDRHLAGASQRRVACSLPVVVPAKGDRRWRGNESGYPLLAHSPLRLPFRSG